MSLLFNMLSRLVITFLPRSKRLLISWLQSPSAVILEPPKVKSDTVSTVSPSISYEVMGPDAMILVFCISSTISGGRTSNMYYIPLVSIQMLWSENKLLFDIQDHSYNLQWLNVEAVAIYEAQGLTDLGWTPSCRVFCVTDNNCLHLAERDGYLFTCCAQSNCTTRLARTSYKIEQIISNVGGGLFWGMYSIHFLSSLFVLELSLALIQPSDRRGATGVNAHFQLLQTFSTFLITTRRTNPALNSTLLGKDPTYNVLKCFQVLELIIFVWTLPSSFVIDHLLSSP